MRVVHFPQLQLGELNISEITIDHRSRDDIPQILRGLQYIYGETELRNRVFQVLESLTPEEVDAELGRPAMAGWRIMVLGSLRLCLNCDYDRILELANNHRTLRQMLGHGSFDDDKPYHLQTIKDNVALFTPEILDQINQIVVKAGLKLKKKDKLTARCDSFVVETNVHYPTDINLLFDAVRKTIQLTRDYAHAMGLSGWRQAQFNEKQVKRAYRAVQQMKRSRSKDDGKQQRQAALIAQGYRDYIKLARTLIDKSRTTLSEDVSELDLADNAKRLEIQQYIDHGERQIGQIERRVLQGEKIPHAEKVFSLFEPHTEWINKGKAGVPVELGLKVCIVESQAGYLLHHQVMQRATDAQIAVGLIQQTQHRYPELSGCSFDKGFHSPANQIELADILENVVLPKKGRCNKTEKARESSTEFRVRKRQHSTVESGINALEVHGLDTCPDHGIQGFKRYVAFAIVARNIQKIGSELNKEQCRREKWRRDRDKLAA